MEKAYIEIIKVEENQTAKKSMEKAKLEVIKFEGIDVIATSDDEEEKKFGATHWW